MYNKNLKWIQDTATSNGFSGGKGGGSQKVLMQAQLGKIVSKVASHSLNIFVFYKKFLLFYCDTNTRGFQIDDYIFQSENWGRFQNWWGPVLSIWNPISNQIYLVTFICFTVDTSFIFTRKSNVSKYFFLHF